MRGQRSRTVACVRNEYTFSRIPVIVILSDLSTLYVTPAHTYVCACQRLPWHHRATKLRSRDLLGSKAERTRRGNSLRSTKATIWPSSRHSARGGTRCVFAVSVLRVRYWSLHALRKPTYERHPRCVVCLLYGLRAASTDDVCNTVQM